jgi:osmotically-inducible protein OsmY
MKKLLAGFVVVLLFSLTIFAGQETMAPAKTKKAAPKAAKETVDCSKVDDAGLAAKVKEKLANTPSLKDYSLNVTASGGTVTLTGTVKKGYNKGTATLQAKRVPCVKKVDNKITVEAPAKAPTSKPPEKKG